MAPQNSCGLAGQKTIDGLLVVGFKHQLGPDLQLW